MKASDETTERYLESCRKEFWKKVFQVEVNYLIRHLEGSRDILSVGCGPAVIEGELAGHGFNVIGLDVSREALNHAPNRVKTVATRAENMPFPESSFDAAIFVASLEFIEDYRKALEKSFSVLRPNGRIIALLLNTESSFFKEKLLDPASYVRKIRHRDILAIENEMKRNFHVRGEYFMGVKDGELFESSDPRQTMLYSIRGTKLLNEEKDTKI